MCLEEAERVEIQNMIGYAFAIKVRDSEDEYFPYYHQEYSYKMEKRYWASYHSAEVDAKVPEEIIKRGLGGFYFFETKEAAESALRGVLGWSEFLHVVLKCEFEDVFEKGEWGDFTAYRAMYRTIKEEVLGLYKGKWDTNR